MGDGTEWAERDEWVRSGVDPERGTPSRGVRGDYPLGPLPADGGTGGTATVFDPGQVPAFTVIQYRRPRAARPHVRELLVRDRVGWLSPGQDSVFYSDAELAGAIESGDICDVMVVASPVTDDPGTERA